MATAASTSSSTWLTRIVPGHAPNGAPILSVLGKCTYHFEHGQVATLHEEQLPFEETDTFYGQGNPAEDAPKLESELVAYKPSTDILLLAKAHSPRGRPAHWLDVGIQVGLIRRIARVFGNRRVRVAGSQLVFTDPEPFESMPLHMGHAYGGKDVNSDVTPYTYPRNPIGKGFIVKPNPTALEALELPNIEDPAQLLTPANLVVGEYEKWPYYPQPMGFGCISRQSHPRYTLAGLPPPSHAESEAFRKIKLMQAKEIGTPGAGYPPGVAPMLRPEYFNAAPPSLRLPHLRGDETITLAHMDSELAQFSFQLPGGRPRAWLDVGEGREEMVMVPDTVTIFKETNQVSIVWRGCGYYGGPESMSEFTAFEYGVES